MNAKDASTESQNRRNSFHRFITCPQNQSGEIISDEDFFCSLEGLYSLAYWGPLYCKQRREEFEGYLHNENLIKLTGNNWLRTRLKLAKYISNFVSTEVEKGLELLQLTLARDIGKNFNFDEAKDLCEKMSVELWRDHELERSILKRRYPLISFYTSQKGFELWFDRNRKINPVSYENLRGMQYCERNENHSKYPVEMIGSDRTKLHGETLNSLKLNTVLLYKFYFQTFVCNWIRVEYRNLSLNQPNLNFYGHVYRGEIMTQDELKNIQQKLEFTSESRLLGGFLLSSSQDRMTAKSFSLNGFEEENKVRVIHKVFFPPPLEMQTDEFQKVFPEAHLVNNALSIGKLSRIPKEQEVLLSNIQTYITDVYQDGEGIWHMESVSCNAENTVDMEFALGDEWQQHSNVFRDSERFGTFLAEHPDLIAWKFNKMRCNLHGAAKASEISSNSRRFHCFDDIIEMEVNQYLFLKEYLGLRDGNYVIPEIF